MWICATWTIYQFMGYNLCGVRSLCPGQIRLVALPCWTQRSVGIHFVQSERAYGSHILECVGLNYDLWCTPPSMGRRACVLLECVSCVPELHAHIVRVSQFRWGTLSSIMNCGWMCCSAIYHWSQCLSCLHTLVRIWIPNPSNQSYWLWNIPWCTSV